MVYREPSPGHIAPLDVVRDEIEIAESRFNEAFWSYLQEEAAPAEFARLGLPEDAPLRLLRAFGTPFTDPGEARDHMLLLDAVTNAVHALERVHEEVPEEIPIPRLPTRFGNPVTPFDASDVERFVRGRDREGEVTSSASSLTARFLYNGAPIVLAADEAHVAARTAVSRGHARLVVRERSWLEGLLDRGVGPFGDDSLDGMLWMEGAATTVPIFQRIEVRNALLTLVRSCIPTVEITTGYATVTCDYEPTAQVVESAARLLSGLRGESTVSFLKE